MSGRGDTAIVAAGEQDRLRAFRTRLVEELERERDLRRGSEARERELREELSRQREHAARLAAEVDVLRREVGLQARPAPAVPTLAPPPPAPVAEVPVVVNAPEPLLAAPPVVAPAPAPAVPAVPAAPPPAVPAAPPPVIAPPPVKAARPGPPGSPTVDLKATNPIAGAAGYEVKTDAWALVAWPGIDAGEASAVADRSSLRPDSARTEVLEDGPVAELVRRARTYRGVLDHPALHADPRAHAERLVALAAGGVPLLVSELPDEVRAQLGDGFVEALQSVRPETFREVHGREQASIRIRRAALRDHVPRARSETVSVLACTNRPEYLQHAVEQVNEQTYPQREIVVILHGDAFPPDVEEWIRGVAEVPATIVRAAGTDSLGRALNAGVEAASGTLIAKMDDDDWYADEHLWDLVLAREYSGAVLVGKAAEFLYLAELDFTMRRWAKGGEKFGRDIAGATMLIAKDAIRELGGWRDVPRAVDQRLLDDVQAAGEKVYRAHGFGFVVNRHSHHTWNPEPEYFIAQAVAQWRGLRFDVAGFPQSDRRGGA